MYQNILMIAVNDIESQESLGVTKKLMGEFHAFEKLCDNAYLLIRSNNEVALFHKEEKSIVVKKQIKGYFTELKLFDIAPKICKKYGIDLCYIRYPLADWAFMRMIRRLHRKSKVYVEIPTFPYDKVANDNRNLISTINYKQDKINRYKLCDYLTKIVTFSKDKEIYGVSCACISNGVEVSEYPEHLISHNRKDEIHLISVALMDPSHGYDRVIEGLKNYYHSKPSMTVKYDVVGNGIDLDHLMKLVEEYELGQYVTFHGIQTGKALDELFDGSDIALSGLASHRYNLGVVSGLKAREYCARGIPFVIASYDPSFDERNPFIKKVELNDDPLDINELVTYYLKIIEDPGLSKIMRKYAADNFSWEKQLGKVLDSVE